MEILVSGNPNVDYIKARCICGTQVLLDDAKDISGRILFNFQTTFSWNCPICKKTNFIEENNIPMKLLESIATSFAEDENFSDEENYGEIELLTSLSELLDSSIED